LFSKAVIALFILFFSAAALLAAFLAFLLPNIPPTILVAAPIPAATSLLLT
jgi:hypothetical protein